MILVKIDLQLYSKVPRTDIGLALGQFQRSEYHDGIGDIGVEQLCGD